MHHALRTVYAQRNAATGAESLAFVSSSRAAFHILRATQQTLLLQMVLDNVEPDVLDPFAGILFEDFGVTKRIPTRRGVAAISLLVEFPREMQAEAIVISFVKRLQGVANIINFDVVETLTINMVVLVQLVPCLLRVIMQRADPSILTLNIYQSVCQRASRFTGLPRKKM